MEKLSNKILVLKLGGQCNLNCKHCHCKRLDFEFNKDIIDYIKNNNFTRITFSGGEPLMYWNNIKLIIDTFGHNMQYKIVTNATLLTNDIVNTLNEYNVHVGISFDGDNHSRDYKFIPKINLVKKLNNKSLVTLYSDDNSDIETLMYEVNRKKMQYDIMITNNHWLNFVHQTSLNSNDKITKELAQKYCIYIASKLELDMMKYSFNKECLNECSMLIMCFNRWIRKTKVRGVKCCNENVYPITIDGRFLLCSYDDIFVGDIYSGVDWDKVESFIPDKCKTCELFSSCKNTCITNITDNECYISKVINKHFYKLLNKYNITYEELEQNIMR